MKENLQAAKLSSASSNLSTAVTADAEIVLNKTPVYAKTAAAGKAVRLYYMDWMRVIAFSILIVFHSAEIFAEGGWWVKNDERSEILTYVMLFFRQWRMPLLFIISGAAVYLTLRRRHPINFINERIIRLLIPLITGMLLIIPPQIYYINKFKGYNGSFWEHYKTVIELQWFPQGAFHWLHLWFLAFIFAYSIVIIPLMQWLKTSRGEKVLQNIIDVVSEPSALFSLMFLLQTPYYIIDSILPASDIAALAQYFPFFLFGAVLSTDPAIRETLAANAGKALIFGIAALTCLYLFFWIKGSSGERLFLFDQDIKRYPANAIFMLLKTGNQWFWLIAILGASIRFFKRGSTALTYANQAVYPFYIFHQTVIIIAGYYVVQTSWNPLIKFSIILGAAFLFILLIYELLLKRTELTRLMFGIKTPTKEKQG